MNQLPEEQVANVIASGDPENPTIGDCYDDDTGDFLGNLTDGNGEPFATIPANITMFMGGYWYVYKMDSRTEYVITGNQNG